MKYMKLGQSARSISGQEITLWLSGCVAHEQLFHLRRVQYRKHPTCPARRPPRGPMTPPPAKSLLRSAPLRSDPRFEHSKCGRSEGVLLGISVPALASVQEVEFRSRQPLIFPLQTRNLVQEVVVILTVP